LVARIDDDGLMSGLRKVVTFGVPLLLLVASVGFGLFLRGRNAAEAGLLVAAGGLVVAVLTLIVAWLAWRRPVPAVDGEGPSAARIKVRGNQSVGQVSGGQVVIGKKNRVNQPGKP
jgi:hypothetical protein